LIHGTNVMTNGKVVLSVLAGLAAGAILGVLFAPDKGSETRKKIARKGADMADDVKEKVDELIAGLTEKFEAAKEEALKMYESGKNHAAEVKKGAKTDMS
jgi:gas vesicle protein